MFVDIAKDLTKVTQTQSGIYLSPTAEEYHEIATARAKTRCQNLEVRSKKLKHNMASIIEAALLRYRTPPPPVAAIYDIVWQATTSPSAPLSVQTAYTGSRILFRKGAATTTTSSSSVEYEYTAAMKFDDWEGVYTCEASLFSYFNILITSPHETTFKLTPLPSPSSPDYISLSSSPPPSLSLTFCSLDNEGYPFICFQVGSPTESPDADGEVLIHCAIGWAKRREFDDEVPGVRDTCLVDGEKERLEGTGKINMEWLVREEEKQREMEGLEEGEVGE